MRTLIILMSKIKYSFTLIGFLFCINNVFAQQTQISDYIIFGGKQASGQTTPLSPGYAVQLGSSNNIQGGFIGSYNLVKTTGSLTIGVNVNSGGTIDFANSNTVSGNIAAAGATGTVISIGSNAFIGGNIDANGSISVGGGAVSGIVTHPNGTTYSGPTPGGEILASPNLPLLPAMPVINVFPAAGSGTITNSTLITPGSYGNIALRNNKTLTLMGSGIYVFNSINNAGNATFVFDFNNTSGNIIIYVVGNAEMGKINTNIINGGDETRIYLETHGTGTASNPVAFKVANGNAGGQSRWSGSIWAPYAAIDIGSGTGGTYIKGALWSGTQVNIQSGVNIDFAPFSFCNPVTANAGPDQIGATTCGLTSVTLAANNPTPGTGLWSVVSGTGGSFGSVTSPSSTFTGNAGTTYTLRWSINNNPCPLSTDDVIITFNNNPTTANAGPDQTDAATCGLSEVTLSANLPVVGTGTWSIVSGSGGSFGNVSSPVSGFSGTQGSTYTLKWTVTNSPCTASTDNVVITFNQPPQINAGPDKAMEFGTLTKLKGHSTTLGVTYHWDASDGGNISTGANTDEITVTAAGTYILTVTSPNGCSSIDTALVTSKVKSIIGSELRSIYETNPQSSPFFIIADGYVVIDVIVKVGNKDFVLDLLQQRTPSFPVDYGLRNFIANGIQSEIIITGEFPIVNLPNLDLLGSVINYCRPYYQPYNNVGLVTSAGDTAMRSNLVRSGYELDGSGIKIGVISDSYATITSATTATLPLVPAPGPLPQTFITNTAAQDVSNGDLPGSPTNPDGYTTLVHVLKDFPIQRSDEGRAMLQIVHDVAPGAELFFRTGFLTAGDFAAGIHELKDAGCNIIVDDITYITEPFLKDGVVAKAVDSAKNEGVTYFSAAGNFANRSYEANFAPADASALVGFNGKLAHDFSAGSNDLFQQVRLAPGNYTVVFQWVDDIYSLVGGVTGTKFDMDIYLTPNTDGTGLIGFNRDNTNGDPFEFMPFTIPGTDSVDYNFLIIKSTDTIANPARLKYIVYRGGIQIMEYNVGTSTLVGQGNAAGAIAVGAARYNKVPPFLPVPELEAFSSIGGTQTNNVVRPKPDFVAPDGGNSTVKLGQDYPNTALDGYSNFFGTSAAAPHAAAAAALIMQGKKKFLNQDISLTTPDEIRSLFQATAVDMDAPGFDYNTGYGFINPDSAMRTFASPTSILIELVKPTNVIPGDESFLLTVKGENFSSNTVILVINSPGDTTILIPTFISSNLVSVTIAPFSGNPEIRAYTPPKEGTNGTDGGYSNSEYFFDADIVISAVPVIKKYGETLPALDTIITINGTLLQDTTLTLADIGLSSLIVTTVATTFSNVGTYTIIPSRIFDQNNPVDSEFLVQYNYEFLPATVTIEKLPLLVTPNNKTIKFGDHLGNISFNYDFDASNIPDATALMNEIKTSHEQFLATNALAVINGGSSLNSTDFENMNMIATLKAINNSRRLQLENNKLVPLTDSNSLDAQYLVDIAATSIVDYNINPAIGKFYNGYPDYNDKALVGASALSHNDGKVEVNGTLVPMINGTLVPMINGVYLNGQLVQLVNGVLVQLVNDHYETIPNSPLVQFVNGNLVQFVNGQYQPIPNGSLVQFVNGSLVSMVNGSLVSMVNGQLVQLVNGTTNQYEPIPNSPLIQLVNGSLVQFVNGQYEPIANNALVQLVNGSLVSMVNSVLVQLVNGSLVPMINAPESQPIINGSLVPMVNGNLVQFVNGNLVQFVNGEIVPVANASLVQIVNGQLVQLVNGSLVPIVNGALVQLVNGSLVSMVNGSLVQFVNGSLVSMVNGSLVPIVNSPLIQLVNGNLVQFVNGEYIPVAEGDSVKLANGSLVSIVNGSLVPLINGSLVPLINGTFVQLVNGSLVSIVNGQLVQLVNGSLVPMVNGSLVSLVNGSLVPMVNGSLVPLVNGSLVPLVNSSLVQFVNGQLVQLVNSGSIGADAANNNTAVIIDEDDVNPATSNWLGAMASLNMITGLEAGTHTLIPGTLVNPNLDITYGNGTVTIMPDTITITPTTDLTKIYGNEDPAFTFTNSGGLAASDFAGTLARIAGNNVGLYAYTLGDLSAGPNYILQLASVSVIDSFSITARPITITPDALQSKVYGNADPVYTYTASEALQNGDSYSGVLGRVTGENVTGSPYAITLGNLSAGTNYTLTLGGSNTFAITGRPVTITPNPGQSKVYGSADPVFTYTASEVLQNGNSFTGSLGRAPGENVASSPYDYTLKTLSAGSNYILSLGGSNKFTITKKTLLVTVDNKTRQYGDNNPSFTVTYSGFAGSETLATSDISGAPVMSTTAVQTSQIGTYPILITMGSLSSSNYAFSLASGTLTITNNPCLITHTRFTNFGNTPAGPTSLWMNILVKISGQLSTNGDYILYRAGTITFNSIVSTPLINNFPVPSGKVIADQNVSVPITNFDQSNNIWITRVPLGFSSTSAIFISGAIINSSTGFQKSSGNTNTILKGVLYSNVNFNDQWAYGIAAYQPQFDYPAISQPGQIQSVNGNYAAGTPIPQIQNLVNGGSGGGGNNYAGSTSSFDNFIACILLNGAGRGTDPGYIVIVPPNGPATNSSIKSKLAISGSGKKLLNEGLQQGEVELFPNPASDNIIISFIPDRNGDTKLAMYTLDGRKVYELKRGFCESGKKYMNKINISGLTAGVYLMQLDMAGKVVSKKVIISH